MTILSRILCLVIGYAFGIFQSAYIIGRAKGIDIRKVGSGNSGTTNALRTLGTKMGLLVFALDFLKVIAAILICRALFANGDIGIGRMVTLWTGLGCVLGHNFPFYMSFHGGKGIACTAAITVMFSWQLTIAGAIVFFVSVILTHYVSLGSLLGTLTVLIGGVIMGGMGLLVLTQAQYVEMILLLVILVGMAWYLHRANIMRLIQHNERKTYFGKHEDHP
ncbi:MAG: glycerol-3-phosphate acyltransferase [Lachnospiraceae bacterium]|jgi:glycerol-3-phosphate acyltransferase PlsY|nr:glycerol-3-phosphate acyltransferase [Lachnospiraceae bacterium]MCI1726784.1 glycerol-3-phosphate acyltransferase [Lachnospiraceae bacterium]